MRSLTLLAALAATLALAGTTSAALKLNDPRIETGKSQLAAQITHSAQVIAFFKRGPGAWMIHRRHASCVTVRGFLPRLQCERARAALRAHRWLHDAAESRMEQLYAPTAIGDWQTAVEAVQRWFPGTASWLLTCSSSEGSWGGFVMNGSGSGAGGWMQYMSGTFWTDYRAAAAYLRGHGVEPPPATANWSSPHGQAIAAGWARYTGHTPPGKWTGAGC